MTPPPMTASAMTSALMIFFSAKDGADLDGGTRWRAKFRTCLSSASSIQHAGLDFHMALSRTS